MSFYRHKCLWYGIKFYCKQLHHVCGHVSSSIHSLRTFATLFSLQLLSMLATLPYTQMLIISTRPHKLYINIHILRFPYYVFMYIFLTTQQSVCHGQCTFRTVSKISVKFVGMRYWGSSYIYTLLVTVHFTLPCASSRTQRDNNSK